jgi:hypothetical protein
MRAQFYSILALIITLPVILFTVSYISYAQKSSYGIADRIVSDQLNQLMQSIELDTKKAMEITARRALISSTNFVLSGGTPLTAAAENITELMLSGNINGSENLFMSNNTIPNWSSRISSKPINFNVELQYSNISVESYKGFFMRVGMDFNATISDKLGISKIVKTGIRKYVTISLLGLEDPLFPLNTQGFVRRIIRRSDVPHFSMLVVDGSSNSSGTCEGEVTYNKSEVDVTKILVADNVSGVVYANHLGIILEDEKNLSGQISCYITGNSSAVQLVKDAESASRYSVFYIDGPSDKAFSMPGTKNLSERYYYVGNGPDFLKRLEGNNTPSQDGLLTFIYVPELEAEAYIINDYSRIAHLYFDDTGSCSKARNAPDWFGIDDAYATEFNISELLTYDACHTT